MKIAAACTVFLFALGSGAASAENELEIWDGYLDYAYVYSSADSQTLKQRLAQYGNDAGSTLEQFIVERFETQPEGQPEEDTARRKAVAYLLDYLANQNAESLEKSVEAIRTLEPRLNRHENRYWYHYILAHHALEKGQHLEFVEEVLSLWSGAVVPLENHFETLRTLSLDETPNAGFASAVPYLHENVARLILIRSQEMGFNRDLDSLASVVRLLGEERVGAYPDVIPAAASSRDYLDRIVQRLDGPESDGGSLTFTLALFEASKHHDRARGLLASEGLSPATLGAMRVTTGAYATAYNRAYTLQGRSAVYTRGLRQLGEIDAAKQRLGVDPEIEVPVSVEGAIATYAQLQEALPNGWQRIGYAANGRQAYVDSMRGLWEEIQEATLNAADYHLARSQAAPDKGDAHSRSAAQLYARYLTFFLTYAESEGNEGVPDSAYFAAHEAAKGVGDAYLFYAARPSGEEIELAVTRYRGAMSLFPFDRSVWSSLATALERQGRESAYLSLVRSSAEAIARSRSVDRWVKADEPGAERIDKLRRAFSDSFALMYLGFGEGTSIEDLERSTTALREQRKTVKDRMAGLHHQLEQQWSAAPASMGAAPSRYLDPSGNLDVAQRKELKRRVAEDHALIKRLDRQITVRDHALPLYRDTLESEGLASEMRSRRDHPVHSLLRRMYYEIRS